MANPEFMRESDRQIRKALIYLPIVTFLLGFGSGVLTAYALYRDHERRIISNTTDIIEIRKVLNMVEIRQQNVILVLKDKLKIEIR